MDFSPPRWIACLLVPAYLVFSNLALAMHSAPLAGMATALLTLVLVLAVRSVWLRLVMLAVGAWAVQAVARELVPALPLLLPPVIVPAALAWTFGHTLIGDRMALVERFARAVHAPEEIDARHAAYARGVTVMWTALLVSMALANLLLIACLSPGGVFQQLEMHNPFPMDLTTFLVISNGEYLVIAVVFVAEFAFRRWRLPDDGLRDPWVFLQRAGQRLPAVMRDLRGR